jgi:peptidoglycan/LPS O-acetylase OafA/YrhL
MVRLKELDILRGLASLNVVIYHYTSRYKEIFKDQSSVDFNWDYGHYGLELFFVISGFVIYMTLQKVSSLKEFSYKRFSRLYPAYWICILLTLILTSLWKSPRMEEFTISQILMNFTMIQGVFEIPNIDGAYWSLIPELFFYTSMGLIYYMGWLKNIRIIAVIWLSIMILNHQGILPYGAYFLNLKYGMFLLAGILFFKLRFDKGNFIEHILILSCLFTAIWVNTRPGSVYVYPIIFGIFYLFIYGKLKNFTYKPLLFLGYISYPLYLLHQEIGYSMINSLNFYIHNEFMVLMLTLSVMFLLAWIVKTYLEKPIVTYLKSKYYPRAVTFSQQNLIVKEPDLIDQSPIILAPKKVNSLTR